MFKNWMLMKTELFVYHHKENDLMEDDYIFYTDDTVVHVYDQNNHLEQKNLMDEVDPTHLPMDVKMDVLEKCPPEVRTRIAKILAIEI